MEGLVQMWRNRVVGLVERLVDRRHEGLVGLTRWYTLDGMGELGSVGSTACFRVYYQVMKR